MSKSRLSLLASVVTALGTIGLGAPKEATAEPTLICGPVCVSTCIQGYTACEPCVYTGECFLDEACFPLGGGYQANCAAR